MSASIHGGASRRRPPIELPKHLAGTGGTLWRGLRLAWQASPGLTAVLWVLVALQACAPGAQTWLFKLLLDDLTQGTAPQVAAKIWAEAGAYAALIVGVQLATGLASPFQGQVAERLQASAELLLLEATRRHHGLALFEDPAFADDREIARGRLARALQEVLFLVPSLLESAVVLATMLFFLGRFSPWLAVGLIAITLPRFKFEWELYRYAWSGITGLTPHRRWMNYCREVLLNDRDAKEVRLYGLGGYFVKRYQETFDLAQGELARLRSRLALRSAAFGLIGSAVTGGAYLLIVLAAARGKLTVGDIALYSSAVFQAAGRLETLARTYGFLADHTLTLQRFFRLVDAPPSLPVPAPGTGRKLPPKIERGIQFREVSFRYPECEGEAIRKVSFTIPTGKTVALVGENGAGKSTLVKLLTRLYDPDSGEVLLDGVPLPEYDIESLRQGYSVVFQDFVRYALSIRDNIAVGAPNLQNDEAALLMAAERGGARDLIEQQPGGLDQMLGKQFAGGVELSGGQWQKLALARAFLREQASILVLDEPTAALDPNAEYELFRQFTTLARGRTVLLVSHRFSTVRMADWIVVLEQGELLEQGTHHDLMAARGRYAELFEMQAERYRLTRVPT